MKIEISSPWARAAVILLCGALASWLTTWPQAWSQPQAESVRQFRSPPWNDGRTFWAWEVTPKRLSRVLSGTVAHQGYGPQGELTEAPAWTTFTEARSETDPASVSYLVSGWPFESFRSTSVPHAITQGAVRFRWETHGGIPTGPRESSSVSLPPRNIPLRPIWSGFALSTLFWSGAIAATMVVSQRAATMVRVRSRRKQGLCPTCSYPATGAGPCPECGAADPGPQRALMRSSPA